MRNKEEIDLLVEQLRTILLSKPLPRQPRVQSEELGTLQEAIFYLADCLAEANGFLHHLQAGALDATPPGRHNFLAGSLKELHAALRHLTWQANQVANGDYSQSVHFLGDFSTSFNQMIHQLAERESQLKIQSQMLSRSVELMKSVMDGLTDWVIVIDQKTGHIIYANQSARQFYYDPTPAQRACQSHQEFLAFIRSCGQEIRDNRVFEYHCCQSSQTFHIHSYEIPWSNGMACAHIISDVTSQRAYQEQMKGLAYVDELTGLHNRRFFLENLDRLLEEGTPFTLSMIDLDGLKYANDSFGHGAGDDYLRTVAQLLLQNSRASDLLCRIGGDEFAILFPHCKAQVILTKLDRVDQALAGQDQPFPMSISYGVSYASGQEARQAQEIMEQADDQMYVMKNMKKAARQSTRGVTVAFVWSKELETGNPQIDAEHQKLIQATNHLLEACAAGKGRQELRATVDFLRQYTLTHFLHEEALQLDHNYPDYPNHKRLHERFLKTVEDLSNRLYAQGPTTDLVAEINKRLAGWLLNHIKTEDARVARHIQTRTP